MTLKENNNKRTDQAWNRLYNRLEQDGLISDKEEVRLQLFRPAILKLVASLAILITASVFIYKGFYSSGEKIISLSNNEESSTYVTTLEDGSVVYLAKNSTLSYPRHFDKRSRKVFLQGDAFFEISKNKKKPFIIETNLVKIQVLGTSFNVTSRESASPSLSVNTGLVLVTLKMDGQSTKLSAGETVLIHPDNLQTIQTADIKQFERYKDRMHFKDERLENVINVINRNSNGLMLEIDPDLKERQITATFANNSPDSMAQLICIALNLKYSQQMKTIRIYE